MVVAGYPIKLTPRSDKSKFYSYQFTQIGNELSRLIDSSPQAAYFEEFVQSGGKAFDITQHNQDKEEST
jgi:hypothetical protein